MDLRTRGSGTQDHRIPVRPEYAGPPTLDSIGRVFGITRERVRQIEKQAILKLRNLAKSRNIELSDVL